MRKLVLAAVAASAAFVATPSLAQDTYSTTAAPAPAADTATAPDGTRAFGIEPYFGVRGGWEEFSKDSVPGAPIGDKLNGSLVEGLVGVNVPLGPVFIGAEGNVAKGVSGDIDWQYGAAGRFGFRAGESGMIYGKVGYQWVNFDKRVDTTRDFHDVTYGIGFEVGPKEIGLGGITGNSGIRLRGEVSTFGWTNSFRPTLGVIAHF
ncbi:MULTISPECIES: opacity protein [Sphingomonas]|uniref:Opacity protein n=1 Tax=Sphingomonas adhaesiva TaxID=28212 RepID=A0A2A4IA48_9SPHN|nr:MULTISPECIES: opacity protein [Sphingomonas]PCG14690.1 opacity protein [Sphingomonas adhaesiva]PZU81685.1 MAG: opacity protein [Sphingomonas sp.]